MALLRVLLGFTDSPDPELEAARGMALTSPMLGGMYKFYVHTVNGSIGYFEYINPIVARELVT